MRSKRTQGKLAQLHGTTGTGGLNGRFADRWIDPAAAGMPSALFFHYSQHPKKSRSDNRLNNENL